MSTWPSVFSPETQQLLTDLAEIQHRQAELLRRQMQAVTEELKQAASEIEVHARVVGERGWTVPTWGPFGLVEYLAQFSATEIDQGLLREYSKRRNAREKELLKDLLQDDALLHWRPLLAECIDVYRRRKYRVVVPSLLTIVEGAVVSTLNLYSRRPGPKKVATQQASNQDPSMIRAAWVSVEAFLSTVFADHDFSSSRPVSLNRHWVLHGRDRPEWGRIECLRLFHALDTIAMVAEFNRSSSRA